MGINKIYKIMNEMKEEAGIEAPRITPYSARKRLIQKLSDDGVPANQIVQISGHKNVNSLNNYSKLNNAQSKNISDILSDKATSSAVATTTAQSNSLENSERQMPKGFFQNSHFHGNVTFNFHNSRTETQQLSQQVICSSPKAANSCVEESQHSPIQKQYKRIRMISESDSD
ncbi:uncharacterized protein LOC123558507 [Mercenaria mercenaria]|uniref:uncharacterized protein LOC123558507 n=1 Tax=Mercenaria mercenaria TaxID=6596 RepID=UPI00234E45D2|nr:uncharacterized protein LOC123558507 [Mercenaria mercenaria]